jgi:hypothetical protein
MARDRWHVRLGEGDRFMTNSQVHAAAARCWIDEETHVRKPGTSTWTTLKKAVPEKRRITKERVVGEIGTSAITILSGEYEVLSVSPVSRETPLTKEELKAARPPRLAPRLVAFALLVLVGGALLARRYVPTLETRLRSTVATTSAVPTPATAAPPPAPVAPVVVAASPTPAAPVVVIPKMRAPSPPAPLVQTPVAVAKKTAMTAMSAKTAQTTAKSKSKSKKASKKRFERAKGGMR